MGKDKTYIYALCEPNTGVVRYVGKSDDPERRYRNHIYQARHRTRSFPSGDWIKGLIDSGEKPELTILEETTQDNWQNAEIQWIAYYRENGNDLLNCDSGGNGGKIGIMSKSARQRLVERNKGRRGKKRNWTPSEETRKLWSEQRTGKRPALGRRHSKFTKELMRAAKLGKKQTAKHIENKRRTQSKLSSDAVVVIREILHDPNMTYAHCSRIFGLSGPTIKEIYCGERYEWVLNRDGSQYKCPLTRKVTQRARRHAKKN